MMKKLRYTGTVIAKGIGRDRTTVWWELRRNTGARRGKYMKFSNPLRKFLVLVITAISMNVSPAAELEEVVVTATKRASTVQDIPMSIQAISGDVLDDQGIFGIIDLSATVPNVQIGTGLSTTFVNIRGMGSGNDRVFEQSVGLFVDDIYMPRSAQYRIGFLDVERVEVLRGSQAVLFGLNSTAGAISVHSRKNRPGDELEGNIRASYETEYETWAVEGAVGGSLSDSLALRLAGKTTQGDDFVENSNTGNPIGETSFDAVRLSAVFEPDDNLSVEGKVEWAKRFREGVTPSVFSVSNKWTPVNSSESNTTGSFAPILQNGLDAALPFPGSRLGKFGFREEVFNANVKINQEWANGHLLTALVGYSDMDTDVSTDLLFSPTPDWAAGTRIQYEHLGAEIRIASPEDRTISYIGGFYYHDGKQIAGADNIFDLAAFGVPIGNIQVFSGYQLNTEVISPFGTATWAVRDNFRVTFGARYVNEDKDISRSAFNATDTGGIINAFVPPLTPDTDTTVYDKSFSLWTGSPDLLAAIIGFAARSDGFTDSRTSNHFMAEGLVEWDVTSDHMVYFKAGNGAKSGGWGSGVQARPETLPFNDEKALSFEVGLKSSLLDGAADITVAVFYTDYSDLQVNSFDASGDPSITNASSSESYGVEIDGRWAVSDWLLLSGGLAYLDAEFVDFPVGPGTADGVTRPAGSDYSGLARPHAPEWSGNFSADVTYPISGSINLVGGLVVSFSDKYFTEGSIDPAGLQDSWTKVDARIGIASSDDKWRLSFRGRNLTDELTTNSYQFFVGNRLAFLSPPRTFTFEAEYRFGQ